MKKLSPVLSPLMASLFFISSTFSFVEAATNTASHMQNINYQKFLYSNKVASQKEFNLFDNDTNSRYTPSHGVLLENYFKDKVSLSSISIYGDSGYALGMEYKVNGLWQKIDSWDSKPLSNLDNSWNIFPLAKSIETDAIRIRINPLVSNPNGIAELKFEDVNGQRLSKFSKNILIEDGGIFGEVDRVYSAKESVVRLSSDVNMSKDGSFSMDISYSPAQISKAILSYDVMGITGGATVIRAINDELAQGGLLVQSDISNKSVSVKEEINPKWLKVGKNIVHFMAHQMGDLHLGYSVKNIKLSLVIDANKAKESKLVVSQPQKGIYYNDYAYIRGFVKSDSKITELRVDGKKINHTLGAFETLIKADSSDDIEVLASLESGERLKKILSINTNFSLYNPKIDKTELSTNAIKIFKNRDTQSRGALFVAKTNIDTDVVLDEVKLSIPKNALKSQRDIKVLSLNHQDLPKLTQGMVNVTKGDDRGYRFLPHGIKFDKDSDLELAFDINKLPKGTTSKDVKTYFFDEETGRWLALEKIASAGDIIHSKTNHFTDMINAVIQVPDAPQAKAYGATQIKDLKVANPGAKINLIQPPQASPMGDASLSYPIEIPAGRQGNAPQLSVNYNSGAQNSWMGLGWNLSVPSIDIDTRWGVPRYDSALESETYTIAGQQLSPVAHRSALIPRVSEKRFYPRVEGSFSKIIRHGNSPKDYFWEVTSKNGSKSFYGGITAVDDNAVLKDATGNIAHWGLVKSIDIYGNSIFYSYTKVAHRGVSDPKAMQGYQLYLSNINYTGYNSDQGVYDVSFTRKDRSDISIDARLGFKRVTADLLEKIEVKYQGTAFRSYKFKYKTGAFEKSLLDTIEQLDADNKVFNTHTMSYFDEIRDASGKYVAFKNESKWLSGVAIPTTPSPSTTPTLITPTPTTPSTTIITDINNDTLADRLIIDKRGLSVALAKVNEHSRVYFDIEKILSHGKSSLHKKDKIVDSSLLHIDNTDGLSDINYKGISYRVSEDSKGLLSLVEDKTTTKSLDNVRVWRVPFDGTIAINANVALLENISDLRKSYSKADGVRVSIQHNETSLWAEQIKADDYTTKSPSGIDNIDVQKDDMILFRVQSGTDGAYDSVKWSPKIEYLDKPNDIYDANHLNLYKYSSQKGYLAQSNMVNIPSTGILKIEGNITKPQTSDDVSLALVKYSITGETSEIWQKSYLASEQITTEANITHISLLAGDKVALNISSNSNIDFKSISWNPTLSYNTSEDLFINKVLRQDSKFSGTLVPKYSIYKNLSHAYGWEVSSDSLLEVEANIPDIFENIDVTFTVKSYNRLLAKQNIKIKDGIQDSIKRFKLDVKKGEKLFFEYHLNRDISDADKALWRPKVTIDDKTEDIEKFGLYNLSEDALYRGWGAYYYDSTNQSLTTPIILSKLQAIVQDGQFRQKSKDEKDDILASSTTSPLGDTLASTTQKIQTPRGNLNSLYKHQANQKTIDENSPLYKVTGSTLSMPSGASALSGSYSDGSSKHGSATIGFNDWKVWDKSSTVGKKWGSNELESESSLILIDIDGDGLPDQLIKSGNTIGYKKNLSHNGVQNFGDFIEIQGISSFGHTVSNSSNDGLEAHIGIFAGINDSKGTSNTDTYFSDVNGDGLVDIVSKRVISYNKLNSDGVPTFTKTSLNTPNPIDESGEISSSGWIEPQTPAQLAQLVKDNPLHDSVRVWRAPENGIISIDAVVNLIEDNSTSRADYLRADGVRVAIQHKGSELWSSEIAPDDYAIKTPQGVDAISVNAGDYIYFRVQSIFDGEYDSVKWSPKISYTDKIDELDANRLSQYKYDIKDDFLLSGYDVGLPLSGTVSIESYFSKPITSDNVILRLIKTDSFGSVTIWQEDMGTVAIDKAINMSKTVNQNDSYRFEIYSDSNVDWSNISWKPKVIYTATDEANISVTDKLGNPYIVIYPTASIKPYSKVHQKSTVWKALETSTIEITPMLSNLSPNITGTVVFTIKKDLELVSKQVLKYENGILVTPITAINTDANIDEIFYIDYHSKDIALASALISQSNIEIIDSTNTYQHNAGVYSYSDDYLFGAMYRNWGQFVYNGNEDRALQPIIESKLILDINTSVAPTFTAITSATDKESFKTAFATEGYDPSTNSLIIMFPNTQLGLWQGVDKDNSINETNMSSSRLGLNNLIKENLIPTSTTANPIRAINQIVNTIGDSRSFSAGFPLEVIPFGISAGLSFSKQKSETITLFSDMNGDRYPDIVGKNQIQYTKMLGALDSNVTINNIGIPSFSESNSVAITAGGIFSGAKIDTTGQNHIAVASTQDPNVGINGNGGTTKDTKSYSIRDINGDGLPDRVYNDGKRVELNLGYSFAPVEIWNFSTLGETESSSLGGGGGINIGNYSLGMGVSISTATNKQTHTLTDLNSDGLIDEIYVSGGVIKARINRGNSFGPEVIWSGTSEIYKSKSINDDFSFVGNFCIFLPPPVSPIKLCANGGYTKGNGTSHDEATLTDIDGDGYLDLLQSNNTSNLSVKSSSIGKTNLLKVVERPLGAKINLDYAPQGNTYNNPHNKWVLSSVDVFDGHVGDGIDSIKQNFTYEDGYYDRYEREFYGFAKVTTSDIDQSDNSIYRKNIIRFINSNYYEKGLVSSTQVMDGAGNIYVEKINAYETIDIFTKQVLTLKDKKIDKIEEKQEDNFITFSKLLQTQSLFYEGTTTPSQMSALEYTYDEYGNVLTQVDLGDFNNDYDNWTATVEYWYDEAKHIFTTPKKIEIYDEKGDLLRHRETSINDKGSVTQVRIDTGATTLTTDMSYDEYGNLSSIIYPSNYKGERYSLNYTLDDIIHSYTTSIRDSFGYTTTAEYDYRFGAQLNQTDINNQPITTTIDNKGRITTITGPLESDLGVATITHSYFPDASTPYAVTNHYDEGRADTIDTATFVDGLMRVIQTKKDASIDADKDGISIDMMSISGHTKFDSFGRAEEAYYPVSEPVGNIGAFNLTINPIRPTTTVYDILNRKVQTTLPDKATLSTIYGFGSDRDGNIRFHTKSTDANGNIAQSFKDVRERITSVLQHNPVVNQANIHTSYSYNAVNELLQVKDDKNNITTAIYDMAGRRLAINNPDTGLIETSYDNAGNVITKITPNLRAESKSISYEYDYNRLTNINYPNNTHQNVTYTYGDNPTLYNLGRITHITDASGERLFEYGKLGETTKDTRTLLTFTGSDPQTYTTKYRYDTWNRLRELTYPDTEVLTHNYDSGGKLKSLQGKKGDYTYDYLKALTYDKFGQRVYTKYANDTVSTYSYEPERRRLSNLTTANSTRKFMDNIYTYDAMQNITNLSNIAPAGTGSDGFGGVTSQNYNYDNIYQLISSNGSWLNRQGHEHRYTLDMSYDTIGNIKAKNQNHIRLPNDTGTEIAQKATSYDWTYTHNATQPHAPTKIGERTFSYDANGNQLGWQSTQNNNHRTIEWDEENRITTISDNGQTSYYVYDAGGERTLKKGAQGETFYVNAYFVIRNGQVASKHFFAGSQRVATKLTKQESQTVNGKGSKPVKIIYEKEQYFYHPDHLGSSSFVTDETGKVFEHLEYFPYGELFGHEHSNTQITPYRFTGKEYDEVTGLYYYGARYYDPRTSVWQSVDPIIGSYMSGQTNGGVFNPKNLSLFGYTYGNPVNFVDPNGQETVGLAAFKEKKYIKPNQTYEGGSFEGRIARFGLDRSFSVNTGEQLINALVEASKSEPIDKLVIGSHGSGSGIYMNPDAGLYGDTFDSYLNSFFHNFSFNMPKEDSRTLNDIKAKIASGEIRFADGAEIYLLGCKTSNHTIWGVDALAEEFSEIVHNSYVIGSTHPSTPSHMLLPNGNKIDSSNYNSEKGRWNVYHNGSLVQTKQNPMNPNTFKINK